jgi:methylated-DNA-[protein]-cysteine S-methyltransferase
MTVHATLNHPTLGEIVLVAGDDGLHQLTFTGQRHDRPIPAGSIADPGAAVLREAVPQLQSYLAGELTAFALPLAPRGTPFQLAVWEALRGVAFGETTTYGAIAAALPVPSAARAVGTAVGRNPISIIVPCHRVLGAAGALTGYAGGLDRKRALLQLEGSLTPTLG